MITFIASGEVTFTSTTTSYTLPMPSGVLEGDVLVLQVTTRDGHSITSLPTGAVTLINPQRYQTQGVSYSVHVWSAPASVPGSITVGITPSLAGNITWIHLRGAEAAASGAPGILDSWPLSTTFSAPSVTTLHDGAFIVGGLSVPSGSRTVSAPLSGWTLAAQGGERIGALGYKGVQASAGSSGSSGTWFITGGDLRGSAWQLAIQPSDDGPGPDPEPGTTPVVEDVRSASASNQPSSVDITGVQISGDERYLLVGVGLNNDELETVSSVVLDPGGANETALSSLNAAGVIEDDGRTELWGVVAPPTGTYTVRVTLSDSLLLPQHAVVGVAWALTNVDQDAPVRSATSASGITSPTTVPLATAEGDLVLGVGFCEANVEQSLGFALAPPATVDASVNEGFDTSIAGRVVATGAATGIAWTMTSPDKNVASAVALVGGTEDPGPGPGVGTLTYSWAGLTNSDLIRARTKTSNATSVRLAVSSDGFETITWSSAVEPDGSGWAGTEVTGLEPDTEYQYYLEMTDASDGVSTSATFGPISTQVPPGVPDSFIIGFGSCMANNSTQNVLARMAARSPDMFFHLGDFHYADNTSTSQASHLADLEMQLAANSGLRDIVASVPSMRIVSDHDAGGGNNAPVGPWTAPNRAAHKQVVPMPTLSDPDGIYFSHVRGRFKFIFTDHRYLRDQKESTTGSLLSPALKPGPTNTGVLSGVPRTPTSGRTITTNGARVENEDISGTLTIDADNVTVVNCKITGSGNAGVRVMSGTTGTVLEDLEISGFENGLVGGNYYASRLNIHSCWGDGAKLHGNLTLEASWIHDLTPAAESHSDCLQIEGNGTNVTVYGNTLDPSNSSLGTYGNAGIIVKNDLGSNPDSPGPVNITHNWFGGGNYSVFVTQGSSGNIIQNVTVAYNRFDSNQRYGLLSSNMSFMAIGNVHMADDTLISGWGNVAGESGGSLPHGTTMMGARQKAWFKNELLTPEPFKIWVQDSTYNTREPYESDGDSWSDYPAERDEIAAFFTDEAVGRVITIHGDQHALSADDGTNTPGGIPSFCAAPFDRTASHKGGPWSDGRWPTSTGAVVRQYGIIEFDDDGDTLTATFRGYDSSDVQRVTLAVESFPPVDVRETFGSLELSLDLRSSATPVLSSSGELPLSLDLESDSSSLGYSAGELPLDLELSSATFSASLAQGDLPLDLGLISTAQSVSVSAGELLLGLGLTSSTVSVSSAEGELPLVLGLLGTGSKESESTGKLPLVLGLESRSSSVVESTGDLPVELDLLGTSQPVGSSLGTLSMTLDLRGIASRADESYGVLPLELQLTGRASSVQDSEGYLSLELGLLGTAESVLTPEAHGTLELILGLEGHVSPRVQVSGLLPLILDLIGKVATVEPEVFWLRGPYARHIDLEGPRSMNMNLVGPRSEN